MQQIIYRTNPVLSNHALNALFSASWPGNLRQLENTIAKLVEIADMKEQMLIDGESTVQILNTLLGQKEMEGADIVEIVARAIALEARAHGVNSLSDCVSEFSSRVRALALEVSGGDFAKAALLIDDSPKAMELFAERKMTEPWSRLGE